MATSHHPKAGSNGGHAAVDPPTPIERSLALTLSPVRQGLRFYADIQRSVLTFAQFAASGMMLPVLRAAGGSSVRSARGERKGRTNAATAAPATATEPVTRRPTTKRATTPKPAAAKGSAT